MSSLTIKDLSIGDWIKAGGEPARVIQLGIAGRNKAKGLSGRIYGFLTSVEIEPIPITPEILEKCGFVLCINCTSRWKYEFGRYGAVYVSGFEECVTVTIYLSERCGFRRVISELPISHIHQLQHALRLVGIDKKIELQQKEVLP